MKLHFDPNQQFQLDAIDSIVEIFEGQPLNRGNFDFTMTYDLIHEDGIGNRLTLSEEQILENVKAFKSRGTVCMGRNHQELWGYKP